jgi:hypothetical protein
MEMLVVGREPGGGKHQKRVFWLMPACDELFALGHVNELTL